MGDRRSKLGKGFASLVDQCDSGRSYILAGSYRYLKFSVGKGKQGWFVSVVCGGACEERLENLENLPQPHESYQAIYFLYSFVVVKWIQQVQVLVNLACVSFD